MHCPFCSYIDTKVVDTRNAEDGKVIRRRRECVHCHRRFTTFEKVEETPLLVVKRDGRREAFDRSKIVKGLLKACEKLAISLHEIEQVASEIEVALRNKMYQEVDTSEIGEMVMGRLYHVNKIAYVRYASVYRQFTDIRKFREELEKLLIDEGSK